MAKSKVNVQKNTKPDFYTWLEFNKPDQLPSKFIPYPKDAVIKFRKYTMGEIEQMNVDDLPELDVINLVLEGIETSFSQDDLTLSDFYYIALNRRLFSFGGSEFEVSFNCEHCEHFQTNTFTTSDLVFIDLFENVPEELKGDEDLKLPLNISFQESEESELKLSFQPLRLKDYFYMLKNDVPGNRVSTLALMCEEEYTKALEHLKQLPSTAENSDLLDDVFNFLYHDLKPLEITCQSCQKNTHVDLENGGQTLIRPFRRPKKRDGSKIRFGSGN